MSRNLSCGWNRPKQYREISFVMLKSLPCTSRLWKIPVTTSFWGCELNSITPAQEDALAQSIGKTLDQLDLLLGEFKGLFLQAGRFGTDYIS